MVYKCKVTTEASYNYGFTWNFLGLVLVDSRKFMSLRSQMISKLWTLWIPVQWQFWKSLKILSSLMGSVMSIGILLLQIVIHCLGHRLMVYWHFGFTHSSFVLSKNSKLHQRQARYLFKFVLSLCWFCHCLLELRIFRRIYETLNNIWKTYFSSVLQSTSYFQLKVSGSQK